MVADFASLPNELVREILKLVQPEDFENFAQVSRNVFLLASPFLTEHRALIRKYHTLRNKTDGDSIATVLRTFIINPRIGSYVRNVQLGQLMQSKTTHDPVDVYTKEELEILTIAALDSKYLVKPSEEEVLDERKYWSAIIQDGNEDILLAILLPLLPNLADLSVQADSEELAWYDSAVARAASDADPALRKLSRIRLNNLLDCGFDLIEIQKFCALPSVTVLTAPMAYGLGCLHKLSPDQNSNVTHLKLWDSCIDSQALYEFLRGFGKLESFTYSYNDLFTEASHDAFLVRSSLLAHCKATLRSLTLLASNCRHMPFMGSLRDFEKLKDVYTEWSYLMPETNQSGLQLNENLPSTLVRLKIHDSEGREKCDYEKVIRSVLYAREHRLQTFKWLVFGGTEVRWSLDTIDRAIRKTCLNMGITLMFSPYAPKRGD